MTFSVAGAISQPRQSCQFPFPLDEKPTVVPVRLAGEQSGGKRKVSYGDARWNSERAAPSACVGRRFSAVRLSGTDRLDVLGIAAVRGSISPDGQRHFASTSSSKRSEERRVGKECRSR